jgi:hypothetical protein
MNAYEKKIRQEGNFITYFIERSGCSNKYIIDQQRGEIKYP